VADTSQAPATAKDPPQLQIWLLTHATCGTEKQFSGLAAAFSASTLLGKTGAVALLVTLFMAVPSYASAELIVVPSILILGVEKMYVKPIVTSENLIFVAQLNVVVFGLVMAIFIIIRM
jgi:urea-proton symporter